MNYDILNIFGEKRAILLNCGIVNQYISTLWLSNCQFISGKSKTKYEVLDLQKITTRCYIYFCNFLPCCMFKGCCESCHYFLSQLDTRHAKKKFANIICKNICLCLDVSMFLHISKKKYFCFISPF